MKILVTGAAGFIGYHICKKLAIEGYNVYGIDNINNYYDPNLKFNRLNDLGINVSQANKNNYELVSSKYKNFKFCRIDITNDNKIKSLFRTEKFEVVCNLAAQAGVRYSIENPKAYIESNINGFINILEGCRNNNIKHLVYASSSSVYGQNIKIPFEVLDKVDRPISLYAATKKSNELMSHTYGHLFGFKTTGLRFFTVYGPWGRPDMAYYLFAKAISNNKPIKVFNEGEMERDFTYIDDIVQGLFKVITTDISERYHYKIYNIGNNKSVKLNEFIKALEVSLNKSAVKEYHPIQPGDVTKTFANVDDLISDYDYKPNTNIKEGISSFIRWFINYNK